MTPFKTLGLSRQATFEEVKLAYRKLALRCHPDKGGCKEDFQEINNAYEKIKDHHLCFDDPCYEAAKVDIGENKPSEPEASYSHFPTASGPDRFKGKSRSGKDKSERPSKTDRVGESTKSCPKCSKSESFGRHQRTSNGSIPKGQAGSAQDWRAAIYKRLRQHVMSRYALIDDLLTDKNGEFARDRRRSKMLTALKLQLGFRPLIHEAFKVLEEYLSEDEVAKEAGKAAYENKNWYRQLGYVLGLLWWMEAVYAGDGLPYDSYQNAMEWTKARHVLSAYKIDWWMSNADLERANRTFALCQINNPLRTNPESNGK